MLLTVALSLALCLGLTNGCGYDSCPKTKPNVINVHLVPHTHDDVGWLKTVDEYYYGSRKDITGVGVQYILDTVIPLLLQDPSKRFIYVEMAFFWRWWSEQDDRMRQQVKGLVQNGQLEFINGGWCMNDEAATHYNAIIDQMTWGLRLLNDTFGECGRPRVAWQIDPFGHSREQANLFAQMGFDGLFFGRLDYADKDNRLATKTMEMMWKGSDSLGVSSWLFTGALYNGYGPPDGFCFDIFCGDEPIMDNPKLQGYNVDQKVKDFINAVYDQVQHYSTNHIIMTMGSDFQYNSAITWYKNLDKLIKYVNSKTDKINLIYSTPSCYLKSLNEAGLTWSSKSDDFFPYASDPHAYWTGYFTSRPALKRMVRYGNNFLQVCKQFEVLGNPGGEESVSVLREAMGVLQHHDAVSGTAQQHVTDDYAQILDAGFQQCERVISDAYKTISGKGSTFPDQTFCHYLNISSCPITETSDTFVVNVYNPLGRIVDKFVRIPVVTPGHEVRNSDGTTLVVQAIPLPKSVINIPGRTSNAQFDLVFKAEQIPPLGFKSFHVTKKTSMAKRQISKKDRLSGQVVEIGYDDLSALVDARKGLTKILTNDKIYDITQNFGWYEGHPGNNSQTDFRASGAYIFRPLSEEPNIFDGGSNASIFKGPLVTEVQQDISPYVSQVTRLYNGLSELEYEWVVGPIPVDDGKGKEIIVQFGTNLNTDGKFYTDSNGRQMLLREKDFRPTWKLNVTEPVSGNYYPVNSRIILKDEETGDELEILTDRSQGGTSLKDGQVELMVHRRLLYDDAFGVSEPLNEMAYNQGLVIRGKHWLRISTATDAARNHRLSAEEKFMDSLITFMATSLSHDEWRSKYHMVDSAVNALPENVHLLTLEEWSGGRILLRLEHQFEVGEDEDLSNDVTVNLDDIFRSFTINSFDEVTLGANLNLNKLNRLQWNVEDNSIPRWRTPKLSDGHNITLSPMQIRSFILNVSPKQ